jgi:hypothetical protein
VARAHAEQDDVIMVVDEAWHDGAAAEIDGSGAGIQPQIAGRPDRREPAFLNRDFSDDLIPLIHRVDAAVRQPQVAGPAARIGGRWLRPLRCKRKRAGVRRRQHEREDRRRKKKSHRNACR